MQTHKVQTHTVSMVMLVCDNIKLMTPVWANVHTFIQENLHHYWWGWAVKLVSEHDLKCVCIVSVKCSMFIMPCSLMEYHCLSLLLASNAYVLMLCINIHMHKRTQCYINCYIFICKSQTNIPVMFIRNNYLVNGKIYSFCYLF